MSSEHQFVLNSFSRGTYVTGDEPVSNLFVQPPQLTDRTPDLPLPSYDWQAIRNEQRGADAGDQPKDDDSDLLIPPSTI